MACAEFIGSQVGKVWRLVDTIYEDRGCSGSHIRRAGFRARLNDIKLGLIDAVVVKRLMNLEGLSEELFPVHQKQLVTQLIDRVTVHADRLDIDFSLDGLMELITELLADRPELVRMYRQLYSSARSHGL